MNKILICPGERPALGFLSQSVPLVNLQILGESLVGHWMEFLSAAGVKDVLVLATDRPDQVRESLADGARWGLRVQVASELQELSATAAYAKFGPEGASPFVNDPSDIFVSDHVPGFPTYPLFTSYALWFGAVQAFLLRTPQAGRLGFREMRPGVWAGLRSQIASSAELRGPCWIGNNVRIGPHAVIGPQAILEDRVVVEGATEIVQSFVGPQTFIGKLTKVQDSLALGSTLINWRTGSCTQVPDAFLMSALSQKHFSHQPDRFSEICSEALVWPRELFQGLKARFRQR
jgi:NDP-sugar pyrophosphorylase family protein